MENNPEQFRGFSDPFFTKWEEFGKSQNKEIGNGKRRGGLAKQEFKTVQGQYKQSRSQTCSDGSKQNKYIVYYTIADLFIRPMGVFDGVMIQEFFDITSYILRRSNGEINWIEFDSNNQTLTTDHFYVYQSTSFQMEASLTVTIFPEDQSIVYVFGEMYHGFSFQFPSLLDLKGTLFLARPNTQAGFNEERIRSNCIIRIIEGSLVVFICDNRDIVLLPDNCQMSVIMSESSKTSGMPKMDNIATKSPISDQQLKKQQQIRKSLAKSRDSLSELLSMMWTKKSLIQGAIDKSKIWRPKSKSMSGKKSNKRQPRPLPPPPPPSLTSSEELKSMTIKHNLFIVKSEESPIFPFKSKSKSKPKPKQPKSNVKSKSKSKSRSKSKSKSGSESKSESNSKSKSQQPKSKSKSKPKPKPDFKSGSESDSESESESEIQFKSKAKAKAKSKSKSKSESKSESKSKSKSESKSKSKSIPAKSKPAKIGKIVIKLVEEGGKREEKEGGSEIKLEKPRSEPSRIGQSESQFGIGPKSEQKSDEGKKPVEISQSSSMESISKEEATSSSGVDGEQQQSSESSTVVKITSENSSEAKIAKKVKKPLLKMKHVKRKTIVTTNNNGARSRSGKRKVKFKILSNKQQQRIKLKSKSLRMLMRPPKHKQSIKRSRSLFAKSFLPSDDKLSAVSSPAVLLLQALSSDRLQKAIGKKSIKKQPKQQQPKEVSKTSAKSTAAAMAKQQQQQQRKSMKKVQKSKSESTKHISKVINEYLRIVSEGTNRIESMDIDEESSLELGRKLELIQIIDGIITKGQALLTRLIREKKLDRKLQNKMDGSLRKLNQIKEVMERPTTNKIKIDDTIECILNIEEVVKNIL